MGCSMRKAYNLQNIVNTTCVFVHPYLSLLSILESDSRLYHWHIDKHTDKHINILAKRKSIIAQES